MDGNSNHLISAAEDGYILVYNTSCLNKLLISNKIKLYSKRRIVCCISKDSQFVISSHVNDASTLFLYKLEQNLINEPTSCFTEYPSFNQKIGSVFCLHLLNSDRQLICGYENKCMRLWDLETEKCINKYDHLSSVLTLDCHPVDSNLTVKVGRQMML